MKNNNRRIIHSPIFLGIFTLIIIIFTVNVFKLGAKYIDTRNNKKEVYLKLEELAKRQENIKNKSEELKTDIGFEVEAKERFNISKEGEKLAIIIDLPKKEYEDFTQNKKTFWQKIRDLFARN